MQHSIRPMLALALTLWACGEDAGPPDIAGGWLDCDPHIEGRCEPLSVGWYFPKGGGPIRELHRNFDGVYGCDEPANLEGSSWTEAKDGSVLIETGIFGAVVLKRQGDLLQSLTDGVLYTFGGDVMTKVAGPEVCDD